MISSLINYFFIRIMLSSIWSFASYLEATMTLQSKNNIFLIFKT